MKVVTFGSTKVGDGNFAKLFTECIPECFRLVVQYDPIPSGPVPPIPIITTYSHVGQHVVLQDDSTNSYQLLTGTGIGLIYYTRWIF